MDAIVQQIMQSARILGVNSDSEIVVEALRTAMFAEEDGFDPDACVALGRGVLLRATQPADTFVAA